MKKARLEKLKQTKGRCEVCGEKANLIHHIDETNHNHNIDNLIVICNQCHRVYHSGPNKTSKFIRIYGITARELAKTLNCSEPLISQWHKKGKLKTILETGQRPKSKCVYREIYGFSSGEIANKLDTSITAISILHRSGQLKDHISGLAETKIEKLQKL